MVSISNYYRRAVHVATVFAACVTALQGVRGEELAITPVDAVEQAQRALTGFMTTTPARLPGDKGYYRAMFDSVLVPIPKCGFAHSPEDARWDLGDCTGRAVLAWLALREMTGDHTTGMHVERGQREFLLSMLHPRTGLIWFSADRDKGIYHYHIWDQSRTLRALVAWFRSNPKDRERLRPLIERMIRGLDAFAAIRGNDVVWGPYAGWPSDSYINDSPEAPFGGHFVNNRVGICIEPIVEYAQLVGDAKLLDIAVRFANCEISGHQGDKADREHKPYFTFGADGSFTGHFHSKSGTLIGIAKLARALAESNRTEQSQRYLRVVKKSYDWIFAHDNPGRGSRIGWIPETPGVANHETCCATDMIELAEALASCADIAPEFSNWCMLYDDAEAITVNMIARIQLRFTPEFEDCLAGLYGNNATQYMKTARLFDGTWLGMLPPNDKLWSEGGRPYIPLGGCCQYAGASGLHAGWRDAMTFQQGTLQVNYFLKRESREAAMSTEMPNIGLTNILLRKPADVHIRVPAWLKPERMQIQVDGRDANVAKSLSEDRQWIVLKSLSAGSKIDVRFPIEERQTDEQMAGKTFAATWRGNYAVQLRPNTARIPILP